MQNVAILGASDKADRYAYKAYKMLGQFGHKVFLVNPTLKSVEGNSVVPKLTDINQSIDTLTMYVNPAVSSKLKEDILKLKPRRVIFNPGSENLELQTALQSSGIEVEEACTLVLLSTNQFEF